MCTSRLHQVVSAPTDGWVTVENAEGLLQRASLLAFEGRQPQVGDWLVVHSGYALRRVDSQEAASIVGDLRAASEAEH
ncbi:MAG TPA: HypC/HybG/HupF family hydrogenase formation chaperone [Acidimicrobiales bacterium]|nr:HypC/HybG/HupF family hydrogenase formation chaperone [Acidimicrobiales bacterium]